jgi:hypothetical protein
MEKKRQEPCNACIPIVYESDGGAYDVEMEGGNIASAQSVSGMKNTI